MSERARAARRSPVPPWRAALAAILISAAGCSDIRALDAPNREKGAAPAETKDEGAADEVIDCDDLPALTPEDLAGLPFEAPLQKPRRTDEGKPPRYTLLPDVDLSEEAAAKVERIDEAFFRKTGKRLVVTSGTRDAARQAKAMHKVMKLGGDILKLYRNKAAAREVKEAYDKYAGRPAEDAVTAMYDVLKRQMDRGVFISAHLRSGAVDVRSRTMSAAEKRAFEKSVAELNGVTLLEESKPPHYHLQLD